MADVSSKLYDQLVQIHRGETSMADLAETIAEASVFVPSGRVTDDHLNGFQPLRERRSGITHVAVFTRQQTPAPYAERAPFGRPEQICTLARILDPTYGIVIDPGQPHEVCLSPEFLQKVRRDA